VLFLPQTNASRQPVKAGVDTQGGGVGNRPMTTDEAA
jgi:hypothetical protein